MIVVPVAGGNSEGDFVSPCLFFSLRVQVFEALFISYLIKLYFPCSKSLYLKGFRAYLFKTSEVYSKTSEVFSKLPSFIGRFMTAHFFLTFVYKHSFLSCFSSVRRPSYILQIEKETLPLPCRLLRTL